MSAEPNQHSEVDPGLCKTCIHSRQMQSDRGSIFYLCQLASRDPRYPKYPRLPVLRCDGYEAGQREKQPR
jgi:hypothetical protein